MRKPDLLATKLHRPSLPARWVRRPELSRRLSEGLASGRPITLVSAPAGFGKTTCISEWLDALSPRRSAWLSLDDSDDDPERFFAYLIAALQQLDASFGRELEGALLSGQLPPADVIDATLINDILEMEDRFLLVLDDFQVIQEPLILRFFEKLVSNPPRPLHLVLVTREDPPLPLALLRADNRLTEIRARELFFSRPYAERFLNEVMRLSLSPADIDTLEEKTEGWIVGLQLAALALQPPPTARDREDPSVFIAALSGDHRFILDYLTEQVLSRQPEDIRRFLLQTSILDRLSGGLCDAVTGRSDGRVLLRRLLDANLFLIPLDDRGRWYRYHHLFADLLRSLQRAQPGGQTGELHRRACRWYSREGGHGPSVGQAMRHALAAKDYACAVGLLERHARGLIMQGYAGTVYGWVQAIPGEWGSRSPRTHLAFAWMHLLRGAYARATPHLERVRSFLAASPPDESVAPLEAEWLVMQALLRYMQGRAAESRAAAARALEIAPEEDGGLRSLAWYALASAGRLAGEISSAIDAFRTGLQLGRAAGSPVAEMLNTVGLALTAFERGQLRLAFEVSAPATDRVEQSGVPPPISAVVFGMLAEVHYQWHQLEPARRLARRALELAEMGGFRSGLISCRVLLSRLDLLEGDLETAAREIREAAELAQAEAPDDLRQEVDAQQVRVHLARNRPDAARLALEGRGFRFRDRFSYPELPSGETLPRSTALLYIGSLHVLLSPASIEDDPRGLRDGVELAGRLIAAALRGGQTPVALEALLLRARLHAALGNRGTGPDAIRADYGHALELGEREGFIAVFVEQGRPVAEALAALAGRNRPGAVDPGYVGRILAAFAGAYGPGAARDRQPGAAPPVGNAAPALIEPLTGRELEVLSLMAEGLKYREIAPRLFISVNTVRFHIKAIYGKLGVNNRTQAITAARQLRLL